MAKEVKKMNKIVAKSPDQAKAQNAGKLKKTVVESGNKSGKLAGPAVKKAVAKMADKPNKVEKLIQDVTNRYRVTAREARDIVTAVNNVGAVAANKGFGTGWSADKKGTNKTTAQRSGGRINQLGKAVGDLKTQISETGKAAVTGKKGTSSGKFQTISGEEPAYLQPGKKRK
jgi:hypothetical protein